MIIYLEGPDGSGKTTLKETIYDSLSNAGYNVIPNGLDLIPTHPREGENRMNESQLFKQLRKMANEKAIYICDRGPISDCVYRVFDAYQSVTTINKLKTFIEKNNSKILLIYCRTNKAEDAMKTRGDESQIALTRHKEITKLFDMVMSIIMSNLKFNTLKYDFTKKKQINEVIGSANYWAYMGGADNDN